MIDFHCDNCEFLQDKSNDNIIDGYCKKYNQSLTFYDWFEKCDKCLIETLQAENAALRERLSRAVEIPDYVFECINGKVERIFTDYLTVGELKNLEANGYSLTKEAAEARLAELKGEKE